MEEFVGRQSRRGQVLSWRSNGIKERRGLQEVNENRDYARALNTVVSRQMVTMLILL